MTECGWTTDGECQARVPEACKAPYCTREYREYDDMLRRQAQEAIARKRKRKKRESDGGSGDER